MDLDIDTAFDLYEKAIEQKTEERTWEHWLSIRPNMDKKSFVPYSKFLEESTKGQRKKNTKTNSKRSAADIISMAEKVRQRDLKR